MKWKLIVVNMRTAGGEEETSYNCQRETIKRKSEIL
jgi:hypothetical protein